MELLCSCSCWPAVAAAPRTAAGWTGRAADSSHRQGALAEVGSSDVNIDDGGLALLGHLLRFANHRRHVLGCRFDLHAHSTAS